MIIRVIKEPFEHIIIDSTFHESALDDVWQEIFFLQRRMVNETGQSKNFFGVSRKNGSGIFLNNIFTGSNYSSIFLHTRNIINDIKEKSSQMGYYFKLFEKIKTDVILVQGYKNGDYYLPHNDHFIFTSVTLLHNEPKKYYGGDLHFPDYKYIPNLNNNSTIIFPSTVTHGVTELKMDSNDPNDYRYTISIFLDCVSPEKNGEV